MQGPVLLDEPVWAGRVSGHNNSCCSPCCPLAQGCDPHQATTSLEAATLQHQTSGWRLGHQLTAGTRHGAR